MVNLNGSLKCVQVRCINGIDGRPGGVLEGTSVVLDGAVVGIFVCLGFGFLLAAGDVVGVGLSIGVGTGTTGSCSATP